MERGGRAVLQYEMPGSEKSYYEYDNVSMDAFLDAYCAGKPWGEGIDGGGPKRQRRWHEALLPGAKVKVFADVDIKAEEMDGTEEDKLAVIVAKMRQSIADKLSIDEDNVPAAHIFDACIEGQKFSVHIVFPIWVENPTHAKGIVKGIEGVDLAPYTSATNRTCKFLRIPHSVKIGKNNPLILRGAPLSEPGQALRAEDVCAGLLTWVCSDPKSKYYDLLREPEEVYSLSAEDLGLVSGGSLSKVGGFGGGQASSLVVGQEIEGRATRILEYLRVTRGAFTATNWITRANGSWECTISPAFPCPTKQGWKHSSHCMFVGSYDSRKVYIRCPADNCRVTIYLPEDFTPIAFANVDSAQRGEDGAGEGEGETGKAWFDPAVLWSSK